MRTLQERFWPKVDKSGPCWVWTASGSRGYGQIGSSGKVLYAHRLSFEWANGPIPEGMQVDHKCHNRKCVKPKHLRLVTNKQNSENRSGAQRNSQSGIRGVCWNERDKRWRAQVKHDGQVIHVGYFASSREAEIAVVAKRLELFTHCDSDITFT